MTPSMPFARSALATSSRSLTRSTTTTTLTHTLLLFPPVAPAFTTTLKFLWPSHPPRPSSSKSFSCSSSYHANPTIAPVSSIEPLEYESQQMIEEGSSKLEQGDVQGALEAYQRSISIKPSPTGYYNLGIALYQKNELPQAIEAWERSLAGCASADVHTNLASAYILSKPPQPLKALEHLKEAVKLEPTDGEIRFNLGAVNEANDHLADALTQYNQARQLGVKRAEQNIRNVGAKLLRKKLLEEQETKKDGE